MYHFLCYDEFFVLNGFLSYVLFFIVLGFVFGILWCCLMIVLGC